MNVDAFTMSKSLSKNESLRQSFAAFVNSGVWVDFLAHYFASDEAFLAAEGRLVQETGNLLHAYKLPKTKTICLDGISFEEEKTPASKYESVVTSYFSDDEGLGQEEAVAGEGFVDIEDCSIFPAEDFLDILLNVVCPIFVWSGFYAHFLKNGPEEGFDALDEDEVDAILAGPHTANQLAIRAQELLLGSAVYFEPSFVTEHLELSDWSKSIPRVMDDLSLCITLLDASLPEPRFVYANKAFTTMTGYTAADLVGKSLTDLLSGEETDKQQSEQITLAMESEMLSKYAITHYTKAGKAFINLVTVKNCGQYTVVVHFPAAKRVKKADLKVHSRSLSVTRFFSCFISAFTAWLTVLLFLSTVECGRRDGAIDLSPDATFCGTDLLPRGGSRGRHARTVTQIDVADAAGALQDAKHLRQ